MTGLFCLIEASRHSEEQFMTGVVVDQMEVEDFQMRLARIGQVHETGVSRVAYAQEWVEAMDVCQQIAEDAGLAVRQDAVAIFGNVYQNPRVKKFLPQVHISTHKIPVVGMTVRSARWVG